ncbi:phosphatidate cytidylyltransferase [Coprobacter tertius]|uniref:Phosphatidate cytidylyltransferase n=1 Tax=Coprobacter tertius TaxID=2944915 RepID=A0ABT1MKF7_9BACT|nr:phosphatidate cytidylyltransferase [Coprobacter tertius]MCP9612931.1 phosphatidate cytidylyltransferase [Coprobacter tertius]
MRNFIVRAVTGILFVIILLGAILYKPLSFAVLFAVITGFTLIEFYRLVKEKEETTVNYITDLAGGIYLFIAVFIAASGSDISHGRLFSPYLLYLLYTFIAQLYAKRPDPIRNWANTLLGQIYIALPFSLLSLIAFKHGDYNAWGLASFFIFIWLNDTGAYLIGCTFGKHRLFERISPKKSWEGFFGGMGFCLLSAYVLSLFFTFLSPLQWLGFGLTVCISATFGDLCESLLKRTIHVKDSGNVLPGHGGMLDRFDSVLLASPAAVIYLIFIA